MILSLPDLIIRRLIHTKLYDLIYTT